MVEKKKNEKNDSNGGVRTTLRYNKEIDRRLKRLLKTGHWQTRSELMRNAMWRGLDDLEEEMLGSE